MKGPSGTAQGLRLPSKARGVGSNPGQGATIPLASAKGRKPKTEAVFLTLTLTLTLKAKRGPQPESEGPQRPSWEPAAPASWPCLPIPGSQLPWTPPEGRETQCSADGLLWPCFTGAPSTPGRGLEGALCPWTCDSSSSAHAGSDSARSLIPSSPGQRVWARSPQGGGAHRAGTRAMWGCVAQLCPGCPQPCPPLAPGCQSPARPTVPRCIVTSCGSLPAMMATPGRPWPETRRAQSGPPAPGRRHELGFPGGWVCGCGWGKATEWRPPRRTPTGDRRSGTPEAPGVTEGMVGPTRLDCWPRTPRTVAGVLRAQSGGGRRLPAVERQRTSTLLCSDYKSTKRSVPRTPASSRSPECRRLRGGPRGLRAAPSRSPYPKAAL